MIAFIVITGSIIFITLAGLAKAIHMINQEHRRTPK